MPVVTICLVISNNLLLVLEDAPKRILFPHELAIFWSAKQRRKDKKKKKKKNNNNKKNQKNPPSIPFTR